MRRSDKKARILTAAYDVFGEKGYYAAKMDDIAELADVAKGTLYLYYANKEELFHAVIEKLLQDYVCTYENILNEPVPFTEKLTSLLRYQMLFVRDRYDFAVMNLREGPFNEAFRQKVAEAIEKTGHQFSRLLQETHPKTVDKKKAYFSYLCFSRMGDGMLGDILSSGCRLSDDMLEERAQFAANLFVNGLKQVLTDDAL
ncbi:MAG: TetR/AcrR family transcriptional regulator [Novibacillus thermophilus]|jgi:TetR/AcrR family fatty acid metabolism transcriptional regulator|nr:TetR/AcrR family transcriptional regulator [Novibacillus thermophilus]